MARQATPAQNHRERDDNFFVARWIDLLRNHLDRHKKLAVKLGDFETRVLTEKLLETRIERPVYIAGLARSGSTLLLELLSSLPGIASHRYRDYPGIYTTLFLESVSWLHATATIRAR